MKAHISFLVAGMFFSVTGFCQDSSAASSNKVTFKNEARLNSTVVPAEKNYTTSPTTSSPIYRDTRLGSSSPMYNTYKKNHYGAGGVTTDPNKGASGTPSSLPAAADTSHH
jgi:hypothetical protein